MRITQTHLRQIIKEELARAMILETRAAKLQYAQDRDPSMNQIPVIHWIDARGSYDGESLAKITRAALARISELSASRPLEISANPVYPGQEQVPNLGDWGWLGLLIRPKVVTFAGDINFNTTLKKTPSGLRARIDEPGDDYVGDYNVITHPDQIDQDNPSSEVEIVLVPDKILGLVFSPAMFIENEDMMPYTLEQARGAAKRIAKKAGLPLHDEFLKPII